VEFLNDYVKNTVKNKILYTEKIWPSNLESIKEVLSTEITQYRDDRLPDLNEEFPKQIIFTKKEIKFALKEIIKNDKKGWAKNKVLGSEFIAREIIGTPLQKKSQFSTHYSFSKPVFLRNNSICIFYSDGNESGMLATYVKLNGKWKYYASFFSWIN
jgi:hypothetical protein